MVKRWIRAVKRRLKNPDCKSLLSEYGDVTDIQTWIKAAHKNFFKYNYVRFGIKSYEAWMFDHWLKVPDLGQIVSQFNLVKAEKYQPGVKLICDGIVGVVVPNYKLPGGVCIDWENGMKCSYDLDWLEENVEIQE